ncbi:deoxyribodipyrimidine photo-lyase [Endozoicomonas sp. Mp262]
MKKQLVWLRSDLRIHDNRALYYASQSGPVMCVFIAFPKQWQIHRDSHNKLWFFQENLAVLKERLALLNIPLLQIEAKTFDQASVALTDLAKLHQCEGIWFNDEYGVNELQRDAQVQQDFAAINKACTRFTDQLLFKPGSIVSGKGEYYKVFTPFKKALYRQLNTSDIAPVPAPPGQDSGLFSSLRHSESNTRYTPISPGVTSLWQPGEDAAMTRLQQFIEHQAEGYQKDRDYPALPGTSMLSPWLTVGAISIRQCFHSALMANGGELDSGSEGITCWLSELVWREFYRHILVGFPRLSKGRAFVESTEKLPWQHDDRLLSAWKQGLTGFPLVDAAMRQLVENGWMHNRLRMVSAMFLSKNLMLDWRLGERFFMEHLIDGDLAANNGGWQWSASTGTDAAPYFRMFNPVNQSRKFDPEGTFIREWLPELKDLDHKQIHEPYGKIPGRQDLDYPEPIVDHSESRKRVLEVFKSLS